MAAGKDFRISKQDCQLLSKKTSVLRRKSQDARQPSPRTALPPGVRIVPSWPLVHVTLVTRKRLLRTGLEGPSQPYQPRNIFRLISALQTPETLDSRFHLMFARMMEAIIPRNVSNSRVGDFMAATGAILEVTDNNFDQEVLKSNQPVMVDFWATWCGPCKALAPIVDEVASAYPVSYTHLTLPTKRIV